MHEPIDIPSDHGENAAASRDRGGPTGCRASIAFQDSPHTRTPRAAASRGVAVSAARISAGRAFRRSPTATHRAAPARPAGLRIVET